EPAEAFDGRVRAAVGRIAVRHPDELVAVFTHGGVIGSVLAHAARSRPFAFVASDNASISHLVVVGERWVVRAFNETGHLGYGFAPPGWRGRQ
ncbi:MAG: histidine phosphatase family protein, partial [Acidimicrobiales bacterium]